MNNNFNLKQYLTENILLNEIEVRTFTSTRLNLPKDLDREINSDSNEDFENLANELIKLNPQIPKAYFTTPTFGEVGSQIRGQAGIRGQADHYGPMSLKDYLWEYFYWIYSNAVTENYDYDKYDSWEIHDQRIEEFDDRREEFADSAMRGQWLVVPEVTDLTDSHFNSLNEIEVGIAGQNIENYKEEALQTIEEFINEFSEIFEFIPSLDDYEINLTNNSLSVDDGPIIYLIYNGQSIPENEDILEDSGDGELNYDGPTWKKYPKGGYYYIVMV